MKTLKYKVAGKLYQLETGPEAQVGDQVKLFLDTEANPELPEFIFGVIQPGIQTTGCCDEFTVYSIEYDETDLGSGFLRQDDVLNVEVVAAVDVVAKDLQDEIERATAAEEQLQENIDVEEAARIEADNALDARTDVLEADSVRYTSQTNSAARQEQARSNVGIGGRILRDASNDPSVDWGNRTLITDSGSVSINWLTGDLIHPDIGVVLNWGPFGLTMAEGSDFNLGTVNGSRFGTHTSQKIGFHNAMPTIQRAGASQVAVVTTASTNTTPYGYSTQEQADALVTLVNEIRATLVEKGIMKGSA